jgi:hypothetical protein
VPIELSAAVRRVGPIGIGPYKSLRLPPAGGIRGLRRFASHLELSAQDSQLRCCLDATGPRGNSVVRFADNSESSGWELVG